MISILNDIAKPEFIEAFHNELMVATWRDVEFADVTTRHITHLTTDLFNSDFAMMLWEKLPRTLTAEYGAKRVYANAHTMMDTPLPHQDSLKPECLTVLYYANKEWKPEYGGETVFFDEKMDIIQSVVPRPGRIVIFDSRYWHCARIQNSIAPKWRYTVAFKLERTK